MPSVSVGLDAPDQPALGLDPEEESHFGELAEPGHVDGLDGRSAGPLEDIVDEAAILQFPHPLDMGPDRRRAPARGSHPGQGDAGRGRSRGRSPIRGVLRLTPEVRPESQPLGEEGVEDGPLSPARRAFARRCQESSDRIIQDRLIDPARDLDLLGGSDGHAHGIERPLGLETHGNDPVEPPPVDRPEEPRGLGR